MNFEQEDRRREIALAKEQARVAQKEEERQRMRGMASYRIMESTAKYMDGWFLDPIIGFILPGFGDVVSSAFALPFIYYSLFVIGSVPLTLAVIYNVLIDMLIGSVPWIGDFLDCFKRSYKDNLRLITGYIDDDKEIINRVRRQAFRTVIFIAILCLFIYWMVSLAIRLGSWLLSL